MWFRWTFSGAPVPGWCCVLRCSPILSHCLGGVRGGGWLAFGDIPIPEEDMPFTPLLPHAA